MTSLAVSFYETSWFRALVIMLVAVVVARVVDMLLARRDAAVARLLKRQPGSANRTRYTMIRRLAQIAILFVGVALALAQFAVVGTVARAMLASVAILAAIIGIAARAPIANLVSGIMIAFSQPVRLGDYISVNNVYGTVEQISLTYTFIRTLDNRRVVIPNEAFASGMVNNYSLDTPGSMVEVTFVVPLADDLESVCGVARAIADELAPSPEGVNNTCDVQELGETSATLRLSAWAAEPLERRRLASDLRIALQRRLVRAIQLLEPGDGRPAEGDGAG